MEKAGAASAREAEIAATIFVAEGVEEARSDGVCEGEAAAGMCWTMGKDMKKFGP